MRQKSMINRHIIQMLLFSFHSFGKVRIEVRSLSRQFREQIERHNVKVDRIRNTMQIINITCYLAKQELPFRGYIESVESVNREKFIERPSTVHIR